MYPVICKIGPFTVYSYGLTLVFAFCIATLLLISQCKNKGLNPELIFNLCFIILVSGIIGARILYVILNLKFYLRNPVEIIMISHGGLAWFGGLIAGLVSCVIYLRNKGLNTYKIFDFVIPYVALAQAIGRFGCFLNGCCFGKESLRFGIYFPIHDAWLIPTQLYSSLALLGIYIILRIQQERKHPEGELFYLYLIFYSLWRFFIEFFRGDSQIFIYGLSIFQVLSVIVSILSVAMLNKIKRQAVSSK
jgi:phosphatidylglycerol:prolipoprotein diacylglycerol transferase